MPFLRRCCKNLYPHRRWHADPSSFALLVCMLHVWLRSRRYAWAVDGKGCTGKMEQKDAINDSNSKSDYRKTDMRSMQTTNGQHWDLRQMFIYERFHQRIQSSLAVR